MRKYTAPSLLILDEIGYLPCSCQAADLIYNIISRRHENRSLILSTSLAFKQCPSTSATSCSISRWTSVRASGIVGIGLSGCGCCGVNNRILHREEAFVHPFSRMNQQNSAADTDAKRCLHPIVFLVLAALI